MLYSLYDMNSTAMHGMAAVASLGEQALKHPAVRHHPGAKLAGATLDHVDQVLRRRGKPSWMLDSVEIDGEPVPVTQFKVQSKPFCDLLMFKAAHKTHRAPVLLVAPLSGHYATLLRETVRSLLTRHDVFITDWRCASQVPVWNGAFSLEAYTSYIMDFMRFIHDLHEDVHVVAVCQPGPACLAATALMEANDDPARPQSLTLMGSPIDTRTAPTEVTRYAETHPLWMFRQSVIRHVPAWRRGCGRRVYPGYLQLMAFMAMKPDHHVGAYRAAFENYLAGEEDDLARHKLFYDEYLATLDLDETFYLDTVDQVFQRHTLPKGEMMWRGERVDLSAIRRCRLMTVEGERDDISAPGQTVAAQALTPNLKDDQRCIHLQDGAGHYGIFSGSRWRNIVFPKLSAFIDNA